MVILPFFAWICFFRRHLVRYYPDSCSYYVDSGIEDAPSLRLVSQSPSCLVQIGQRTEHKQGIGILVQPTVADLGEAEHALDDRKDMLHPGPDFRLGAVACLGRVIHRLIAAPFLVREVLGTAARGIARTPGPCDPVCAGNRLPHVGNAAAGMAAGGFQSTRRLAGPWHDQEWRGPWYSVEPGCGVGLTVGAG